MRNNMCPQGIWLLLLFCGALSLSKQIEVNQFLVSIRVMPWARADGFLMILHGMTDVGTEWPAHPCSSVTWQQSQWQDLCLLFPGSPFFPLTGKSFHGKWFLRLNLEVQGEEAG